MSTVERLNWSLQQYSITHLIASGHFGTVYHAQHAPTGREVALKLIPLQGQDSEEKVAAERHGAVLQQRFGAAHAGLVPDVYEHQTLSPFYAIAMELVQGRQLTTLIADGPVPSRQAVEIALAIARFLEKAHRFETEIEGQRYALIVHADLKPDHILLLAVGGIRVLDFGIAKALAARTLVTTNKWGSVQYASPERLQSDGHVNEHADFWSLGVMLFEMLAGYRPYRKYEHNPSALDNAIRRQEPREPLPPHIEAALVAIVHKLLAPQVERRYQHAAAIVHDLEAFLEGAPTAAGLEHAQASQETVRLTRSNAPDIVPTAPVRPTAGQTAPTEPLVPRTPVGTATPPAPTPPAAPVRTAASWRPPLMVRLARAAIIALILSLIAGEGVSLIRGQRLLSEIPAIDIADLGRVREQYARLGRWTMMGLGRWRVSGPLVTRMLQLADPTIVEFRNELPKLNQRQWEQAAMALDFAAGLAPGDLRVASRRAYVRGQLAKIDDRYPEAIRRFREAARLDQQSFDPYLGLAAVFAYGTRDLEGLTTAIAEAERRGYRPGRRERAELGDLHKVLADDQRSDASRVAGPQRIERLERAAADYTKCIEYFDGLLLAESEANLKTCRKRLSEVQAQLPPVPAPAGLGGSQL
jgi:serine/threonine-protein kinase